MYDFVSGLVICEPLQKTHAPNATVGLMYTCDAQVYDLVSCGRIVYRQFCFTSDASRSLHAPPAPESASVGSTTEPPAPPCRGSIGDPPPAPAPSLRVKRNLSPSLEHLTSQTLVPRRFLRGYVQTSTDWHAGYVVP